MARRHGVARRGPAHRARHGSASARGVGVGAPRVARERLPGAPPRRRCVPRHLDAPHAADAMPRVRPRLPRGPGGRRRRARAAWSRPTPVRTDSSSRQGAATGPPSADARSIEFSHRAGGEACAGAGADPVWSPLLEDPPSRIGPEASIVRKSLKVGALSRTKPRSRRVNPCSCARKGAIEVFFRSVGGVGGGFGTDAPGRPGGPHVKVTSRPRVVRTPDRAWRPRPRHARRARAGAPRGSSGGQPRR